MVLPRRKRDRDRANANAAPSQQPRLATTSYTSSPSSAKRQRLRTNQQDSERDSGRLAQAAGNDQASDPQGVNPIAQQTVSQDAEHLRAQREWSTETVCHIDACEESSDTKHLATPRGSSTKVVFHSDKCEEFSEDELRRFATFVNAGQDPFNFEPFCRYDPTKYDNFCKEYDQWWNESLFSVVETFDRHKRFDAYTQYGCDPHEYPPFQALQKEDYDRFVEQHHQLQESSPPGSQSQRHSFLPITTQLLHQIQLGDGVKLHDLFSLTPRVEFLSVGQYRIWAPTTHVLGILQNWMKLPTEIHSQILSHVSHFYSISVFIYT